MSGKGSTAAPRTRYYGIGFGQWVEIRSAQTPPKAVRTSFSREAKERYLGYDKNGNPHWLVRMVPTTFTITVHEGGKVLGAIQWSVMYSAIRRQVSKGNMIELTREEVKRLASIKGDIRL